MNLLLLQFNNYLNRTVKIYTKISDKVNNDGYVENSTRHAYQLNVNFNPNDDVSTTQVINWKEDFHPDYLVCFNEDNSICSRWYVIKWTRLRTGQYQASLKRDTIADNFRTVISAPCFIEKATIKSTNDVCIFNSEGMNFNQIKKSERLIQDDGKLAWIVGYFTKLTADKPITTLATSSNVIYASTRSGWEFHQYESNYYKLVTSESMKIRSDLEVGFNSWKRLTVDVNTGARTKTDITPSQYSNSEIKNPNYEAIVAQAFAYYVNDRKSSLYSAFYENETNYKKNDILSNLNGKLIYFEDDGTGQPGLFKIAVTSTDESTSGGIVELNSTAEQQIMGILEDFSYDDATLEYPNEGVATGLLIPAVYVDLNYKQQRLVLTQVYTDVLKTQISASANKLTDAPYGMFAIPYGKCTFGYYQSLSQEQALNIAMQISTDLGGTTGNLIDIQLLPFCPWQERIGINGFSLDDLTEHEDFEYITDNAQNPNRKGFLIYCPYSKFTFEKTMQVTNPTDVVQFKIQNETKFYRLMSPNGASQFEFKGTKTGSFNKISIDCTYKPYNPYIHINPIWNEFTGLYGQDFDDYRGLICQGDFSLPIINDQWKNYQIQNKNYLNAFNRQTDSLELQYKYQRLGNILGAGVGALSGATSGALTGGLVGGPIGAVAGGVIGGVTSAIGGALDVGIADKLYQDQMDLRKDQFVYNMQNIEARPDTLAKTSAFDNNNKIFPYLETYDSTEQEHEILRNKMLYEGMTIMKVGSILEYLSSSETYIRGNIIKLDDLEGDYQVAEDIKREVALGIRAKEI